MAVLLLVKNTRYFLLVARCPRTQILRYPSSIFLIRTLDMNSKVKMNSDLKTYGISIFFQIYRGDRTCISN